MVTHPPTAEDRDTLQSVAAVIFAAGMGTRMRCRLPKPLIPISGIPMTRLVVEACRDAGIQRIVVVVGHQADEVRAGLGPDVEYVLQQPLLGTAHALLSAEPSLAAHEGEILVLNGDMPLLRSQTLKRLVELRAAAQSAAALVTARSANPIGYGRIVRNADGTVRRVVEHRDANALERAIQEWNPSVYCFSSPAVFAAVRRVAAENAQREFYLPDVIGILASSRQKVEPLLIDDLEEVMGVNTQMDLADVSQVLRKRVLTNLMLSGVRITDPTSTYVDVGVRVAPNCVIEPCTMLLGTTVVEEGCTIGPFARIVGRHVPRDTEVRGISPFDDASPKRTLSRDLNSPDGAPYRSLASMSHEPRVLRVFLCHGKEDKEAVRTLYQRLLNEDKGIEPWFDEANLLPGQDWRREIEKAVKASDIILVCLSRISTSRSGFVQREITLALDAAAEKPKGTIFNIPVRLEECDVPNELSSLQWVDYFSVNGYTSLLRSLRSEGQRLGIDIRPQV